MICSGSNFCTIRSTIRLMYELASRCFLAWRMCVFYLTAIAVPNRSGVRPSRNDKGRTASPRSCAANRHRQAESGGRLLLRLDLDRDRIDPALGVGVVVEVGTAGGAAVLA